MAKIIRIVVITLTLIILAALIFNIPSLILTGKTIDKHTFTKAICEDNTCQDHIITCENSSPTSITPTGAVIQLDNNWQDPRTQEQKEKLC